MMRASNALVACHLPLLTQHYITLSWDQIQLVTCTMWHAKRAWSIDSGILTKWAARKNHANSNGLTKKS